MVEVAAVRDAVERHSDRYFARVYTERELEDCGGRAAARPESLAARFAAKEATLKVLRPRSEEAVPWSSVEVVRTSGGWVEIVLHGPAAELASRAGVTDLAVSLTHEADYAAAAVIAQGPVPQEPA